MIRLANAELAVDLLHPVDDRALLGPRFCTGGYIYQIEDLRRSAPLLTGPEYPSATPLVINGQGMPDVFQHTLYASESEVAEKKLIIGVGLLDNSAGQKPSDLHFKLPVEAFCEWEITTPNAESVTMKTRQEWKTYVLELERTVTLRERHVVLATRIRNASEAPIAVRMFSHPFFPRMEGSDSCMPEFSCVLPENPGFFRRGDGSIGLVPSYDWQKGCFLMLEETQGKYFSMRMRHPVSGELSMSLDYPLLKVALWANDKTFSIEPFIERAIAPGSDASWSVTYRF